MYFFECDSYLTGLKVWRTDGTEEGTVLLHESPIDTSHGAMHLTDEGLFFFNYRLNWSEHYLMMSDGTKDGTKPIYTLSNIFGETADLDGPLYFVGTDHAGHSEPWVTDGTVEGTKVTGNDLQAVIRS